MKLIFAAVFFLTFSVAFAQGPGGGQRGGQQGPPKIPTDKEIEQMISDLSEEVALNADQETKVLALYKAHFEQVKAKTSGNSRPKREDMEALDTSLQKQVKAELTDAQISKYEAYLKKQEKLRPKR